MAVKLTDAVQKRLHKEQVIWLTTVTAEGQPQSSLVWFLWDGHTFLIYSQPKQGKLKALQANPRVALNLNSSAEGGQVVTIEGQAEVIEGHAATSVPTYIDKYRTGIKSIGKTPDSFAKEYSVAVRITPQRVRAW